MNIGDIVKQTDSTAMISYRKMKPEKGTLGIIIHIEEDRYHDDGKPDSWRVMEILLTTGLLEKHYMKNWIVINEKMI
mgnify:CR=1 FL=1